MASRTNKKTLAMRWYTKIFVQLECLQKKFLISTRLQSNATQCLTSKLRVRQKDTLLNEWTLYSGIKKYQMAKWALGFWYIIVHFNSYLSLHHKYECAQLFILNLSTCEFWFCAKIWINIHDIYHLSCQQLTIDNRSVLFRKI